MAEQEWMADQVEVTVEGFLTTRHHLETPAGSIGELVVPPFNRENPFHGADGRELSLVHTSWWKGQHELREGGQVLGRAWPEGFFRRRLLIEYAGQRYTLDRRSFWNRSWQLFDAAGLPMLTVEPRGILRRGAVLTVQAEIPVELLVFAYYLVHNRWQEETTAATTAAAAS